MQNLEADRFAGSAYSHRWLLSSLVLLSLAALACFGGGRPALAFSPDQLPNATIGQIFSETVTVTQNVTPIGQMSVGLAGLPPGLSFSFHKGQNTGLISGTPLRAGTYNFTVSAWCFGTNTSGQTGHHDYQIVVQ